MVPVFELELQLDAAEVGRRRLESEPVPAGLELVGEAGAPVGVGLGRRDDPFPPPQLDADAASRPTPLRVEDVRRERDAHPQNFSPAPRGPRALCPSPARTRRPPRAPPP